jgi:beta-glucanase (GH16 family)
VTTLSPPPSPPSSPQPSPPRRPRRPVAILIAALAALALLAAAVFAGAHLLTPGSSGGRDGAPGDPTKAPSAGSESSAATLLGWGAPNFEDDFDGPLGPVWQVYDGPGHVGNGVRSPDAISVEDGILTIDGDGKGTTGGLSLGEGQMYGRWEGRVRAPVSDDTYNALLLLWPDAEDWPAGGEVDFMEMLDAQRQKTRIFVHYGEDNSQVSGEVAVDATQWHNWAVEWTPQHIVAYLDGKEWYRTSDEDVLPPRPMHLAVQLDWFPEQGDRKDVEPSQMDVDWIKQYPFPTP